jgi:hypothetical protein
VESLHAAPPPPGAASPPGAAFFAVYASLRDAAMAYEAAAGSAPFGPGPPLTVRLEGAARGDSLALSECLE